jgi:hypothetical protein
MELSRDDIVAAAAAVEGDDAVVVEGDATVVEDLDLAEVVTDEWIKLEIVLHAIWMDRWSDSISRSYL